MAKKKEGRIDLLDGCYMTPVAVVPSDWDKTGASVKERWRIWYRFYDPIYNEKYPGGKLCMYEGMNGAKTLGERRVITRELVRFHEDKIFEQGWNPIRKVYMKPKVIDSFDYIIAPDTGLNDALTGAFDRISKRPGTEPEMRINLTSVLKYFKKAAIAAMQADRPIAEVKRRHMVMCWEQLEIIKGKAWTANMHNYYRSYMIILFQELYTIETIEVIPFGSIPKRATVKKERETLTMDQRAAIDVGLKKDNYRLWFFMQVFFHSGARTTEILQVKAGDVDLEKMRVRYIVKKGRGKEHKVVYRPIKEIAAAFWKEAISGAAPDQFVFSVGLKPGDKSIRREQITRRWRMWVKEKYNVTADWYSLKHLNTSEVVDQVGNTAAARLTGHTSTKMIDEVYDVRKEDRESELVRGVNNKFA